MKIPGVPLNTTKMLERRGFTYFFENAAGNIEFRRIEWLILDGVTAYCRKLRNREKSMRYKRKHQKETP